MPKVVVLLAVIAVLILFGVGGGEVGSALGQGARFVLEAAGGFFNGIGDPSTAVG
jgi:hypothetical protein